jgi:TolA-binding protein
MRKLNTIIAPAMFAVMALSAATPSLAQGYPGRDYPAHSQNDRGQYDRGHNDRGYNDRGRVNQVRAQIDQLQMAVNRSDNRDRISEREARGLRNDVRSLQIQFRRFARDGLSNREYRTLENRIENIRARLHLERRDRNDHRM